MDNEGLVTPFPKVVRIPLGICIDDENHTASKRYQGILQFSIETSREVVE